MPAFTPPISPNINFAMESFTPPADTAVNFEMDSIIPPTGTRTILTPFGPSLTILSLTGGSPCIIR